MVSVTMTQLCRCSTDSRRQYGNEWAWLYSNKTLFTKTVASRIWPTGCSLWTPAPVYGQWPLLVPDSDHLYQLLMAHGCPFSTLATRTISPRKLLCPASTQGSTHSQQRADWSKGTKRQPLASRQHPLCDTIHAPDFPMGSGWNSSPTKATCSLSFVPLPYSDSSPPFSSVRETLPTKSVSWALPLGNQPEIRH